MRYQAVDGKADFDLAKSLRIIAGAFLSHPCGFNGLAIQVPARNYLQVAR